jgi:hypothetical protein
MLIMHYRSLAYAQNSLKIIKYMLSIRRAELALNNLFFYLNHHKNFKT